MKKTQNSKLQNQIQSNKNSRKVDQISTQNSDQKETMFNLNIQKKYRKFKYTSVLTKLSHEADLSFTFNKNNTILFIGSDHDNIAVYAFNNRFKKISSFQKPFNIMKVYLTYLQNSHQLESQSKKSITIWDSDCNLWNPYQRSGFMTPDVSSIVVNQKEDFLIAGSSDYDVIKFWRKVKQSWEVYQGIRTKSVVFSLSLNNSETKLISCGGEGILVIELQSDQIWKIIQTIEVKEYGFRSCFLNDNRFVFQQKTEGILAIFDYENKRKQFINTKNIQVQECSKCNLYFPCQFIEPKNILMVNHGRYINFFWITFQWRFNPRRKQSNSCIIRSYTADQRMMGKCWLHGIVKNFNYSFENQDTQNDLKNLSSLFYSRNR